MATHVIVGSGPVGTAVSKICRYEVARTGLSTSECDRYGFDGVAVTIAATTRAGYYPGSGPISVRLRLNCLSGV